MDDEIIHSWCFHDVECFDSTPSATIIILDKDLESFSSLRSQQGHSGKKTKIDARFHFEAGFLLVLSVRRTFKISKHS